MSKKISLIMATILLATLVFCSTASLVISAQTANNGAAYIYDVNGDSEVDITDLVCIYKYSKDSINSNISLLCADINADSKIDNNDFALLRKELLKSSDIVSENNYNWSESFEK